MPTFPSSPPQPDGGFSHRGYGLAIGGRLPAEAPMSRALSVCFPPQELAGCRRNLSAQCRSSLCAQAPGLKRLYPALPQGPSLRSGLFCPGHARRYKHTTYSQAQHDFTVAAACTASAIQAATPLYPRRPTAPVPGYSVPLRSHPPCRSICDSADSDRHSTISSWRRSSTPGLRTWYSSATAAYPADPVHAGGTSELHYVRLVVQPTIC